jgi:hypothetical protein
LEGLVFKISAQQVRQKLRAEHLKTAVKKREGKKKRIIDFVVGVVDFVCCSVGCFA